MFSRICSQLIRGAQYHSFSILPKNIIIPVPQMGESIKEGTLVMWEKKVGDSVKVDDVIAIIETDKVSIDVRSDFDGKLIKQYNEPDDIVLVNKPLAELEIPDA